MASAASMLAKEAAAEAALITKLFGPSLRQGQALSPATSLASSSAFSSGQQLRSSASSSSSQGLGTAPQIRYLHAFGLLDKTINPLALRALTFSEDL